MSEPAALAGAERLAAPRARTLAALFGFGLLIATAGAMTGVGGGVFAVPLLHVVMGLTMRRAVANSCALVAATTTAATCTEALHADDRLLWPVVLALAVGGLCGAQLGFRAAQRIDARRLKLAFSVVLVLAAARLALGGGGAATPGAALAPGPGGYGLLLLLGVVGGFLAPLLGIGGGLVVVPALVLAFPALGFLGARANSMAMSAVNGWRSLVLWHGRGEVDLPRAGAFGGGALLGAVAGVHLVHLDGADRLARLGLAFVLVLVAARFVRDARQA